MKETTLSVDYEFPEGPSQGPDGFIYVAEMGGARISRFGIVGERELFAPIEGSPGATAFGPDGAVYVTNNGGLAFANGRPAGISDPNSGGSIDKIDPDGRVQRLYTECDGTPLVAPNDLVFDQGDSFYFTDPEHGDMFTTPIVWPPGHVYWATIDGRHIKRVATDYELSNGIAITPDGGTLLVCETLRSKIWAHEIRGPGQIGPRVLFGDLPEGHMPDGCCIDIEGNVIAAAVGAGALVVLDSSGKVVDRIETEDTDVTNVCFVGPNIDARRTLIATEGLLGRVVSFEWPRAGLVPFPERSLITHPLT